MLVQVVQGNCSIRALMSHDHRILLGKKSKWPQKLAQKIPREMQGIDSERTQTNKKNG